MNKLFSLRLRNIFSISIVLISLFLFTLAPSPASASSSSDILENFSQITGFTQAAQSLYQQASSLANQTMLTSSQGANVLTDQVNKTLGGIFNFAIDKTAYVMSPFFTSKNNVTPSVTPKKDMTLGVGVPSSSVIPVVKSASSSNPYSQSDSKTKSFSSRVQTSISTNAQNSSQNTTSNATQNTSQDSALYPLINNIIARVGILESLPRNTTVVSSGGGISVQSFNALADSVSRALDDFKKNTVDTSIQSAVSNFSNSLVVAGSLFSTSSTRAILSAGDNLSYDSVNGIYSLATSTVQGMVASSVATSTVRGMFSSTATGLNYSNSTGAFSFTSGYNIPLTASTTEWAAKVSSQWTTHANGTDISYSAGKVGIGTSSPSADLAIKMASATSRGFILQTAAGQSSNIFEILDSSYVQRFYITPSYAFLMNVSNGTFSTTSPALTVKQTALFDSGAAGTIAVAVKGRTSQTADLQQFLDVNNTILSVITASGGIGVGTSTPSAKLAVSGTSGSISPIFTVASSTQTPYFTVTSAGKTGIGTTTPGVSLSVAGSALITGSLTTNSTLNTAGGNFSVDANGNMNVYGSVAFGNSQLAINSSGNFVYINGIAASFPSSQGSSGDVLTNDGSGNLTWGPAGGSAAPGGSTGQIQFNSTGVLDGFGSWNGTTLSLGNGALSVGAGAFTVDGSGNIAAGGTVSFGAGAFTVDSSGNITKINNVSYSFPSSQGYSGEIMYNNGSGILSWGAAPSDGNDGAPGAQGSPGADGNDGAQGPAGNDGTTYPAGANGTIQFNNSGSFGGFGSWDGSTFSIVGGFFQVDSDGDQTANSAAFTGTLSAASGYFTVASDGSFSAANTNFVVNASGATTASGGVSFANGGFIVDGSGNVGIQNSSPNYALDVTGNINVTNTLYQNGTEGETCTSDVVTTIGGVVVGCGLSDARYKTDITTMATTTLDKLNQLNAVTFHWNDVYKDKYTNNTDLQFGFIAQEVQSIFPDIVSQDKKGYFSVRYGQMTAILTSGIQELYTMVKDLKVQVADITSWFGEDGDRFNVKGLMCVDDVCVTKEQFKQILINSGSVNVSLSTSTITTGVESSTTTFNSENISNEASNTSTPKTQVESLMLVESILDQVSVLPTSVESVSEIIQ